MSPRGQFETWESRRQTELKAAEFSNELGQKVLYEDDKIRLWLIQLQPKERMGFRKINSDFRAMSQVDGFAVSHRSSGEILLVQCKKGDMFRYNKIHQEEQVWDLENIGNDPLELVIIEYLFVPE